MLLEEMGGGAEQAALGTDRQTVLLSFWKGAAGQAGGKGSGRESKVTSFLSWLESERATETVGGIEKTSHIGAQQRSSAGTGSGLQA